MDTRIAIVIDPWDHPFNGTVVSTRRFAAALAERGHGVSLLTIGPDESRGGIRRIGFEPLRIPGANRIIDAMRSPLARPDRERIRAALEPCSLVHVQYPFFLGWAAVTEARRLGIPVVCSFHVQPENILANLRLGGPVQNRWLYRLFRRGFYDRAECVVAPSPFAATLLRDQGVSTPVTVVSNGVPKAFLQTMRRPPGARFRVLCVGRLSQEKQPQVLLRAVARCRHREHVDVTLAGAGPLQGRLTRLARSLGVAARIGPVDDAALLELYRGADLFVHCGGVELEGMSVLEAMATGNTVLVAESPTSAAPALVENPAARYRPGDVAALAAAIDDWLSAPERRAAEGSANRQRANAYRHERSVDALLGVYRSLTSLPDAVRAEPA